MVKTQRLHTSIWLLSFHPMAAHALSPTAPVSQEHEHAADYLETLFQEAHAAALHAPAQSPPQIARGAERTHRVRYNLD